VVNAAGPFARPLAEAAGLGLELRCMREQDTVWQARSGRPHPSTSISNAVDAIYLRPSGPDRFVIGRGFPKPYEQVDPYNYRETPDDGFIRDVQERAERRVLTLAGMKLVHAYTALYDVTPDWYPFVGPRSGLDGYYDACGGSGHGFKIAPAMGEELARCILTGEVQSDFAGLGHDRIAAGRLFQGAYGGNRG
jgi:sarcosine oxidase subunit beta